MGRPKGYANWDPQPETVHLIEQVKSVLEEYRKHLPLTVRQIFYRLVGQYGYDKTERAYSNLCEKLVRARRAEMIPFRAIRDDGTIESVPRTYDDVAAFWTETRDHLDHYSRDRLNGQEVRVELWCEAAGMVPQLFRVASPYSIPVYSTGGFSSVTVTHEIAQRAFKADRPTVFLHVGDYDPSGESIFSAMSMDAEIFVLQERSAEEKGIPEAYKNGTLKGAQLVPKRVALTEEQVEEHGLPTAPPKKSDTRSRNWEGETCQAEAMPPDLLAQVVREAIEAELDLDRYEEERSLEQADRDAIGTILEET